MSRPLVTRDVTNAMSALGPGRVKTRERTASVEQNAICVYFLALQEILDSLSSRAIESDSSLR